MVTKEIKPTPKKIKAVVGGKTKFIVLIKNWLHQGFTYLDKTERFYRIIWEIIPFSISIWGLSYIHITWILNIVIAFIISHTLNWAFNDNIWTCIQFTFPKVMNPGNEKTLAYLKDMQQRFAKYD